MVFIGLFSVHCSLSLPRTHTMRETPSQVSKSDNFPLTAKSKQTTWKLKTKRNRTTPSLLKIVSKLCSLVELVNVPKKLHTWASDFIENIRQKCGKYACVHKWHFYVTFLAEVSKPDHEKKLLTCVLYCTARRKRNWLYFLCVRKKNWSVSISIPIFVWM